MGVATARQAEYYTIDDINNLPEGQRAELIDGELYMMASPGTIHQRIVMELAFHIRSYIGNKKGNCEVFPAPFAVFLNADKDTYLEPDISVVCDPKKLTDVGCNGAPDWIIEVVSPTSRPMDYNKKLFKYHAAGVREYWIVDYERDLITVYDFENDEMMDYSFSDKVIATIYADLEIDFSNIIIE